MDLEASEYVCNRYDGNDFQVIFDKVLKLRTKNDFQLFSLIFMLIKML